MSQVLKQHKKAEDAIVKLRGRLVGRGFHEGQTAFQSLPFTLPDSFGIVRITDGSFWARCVLARLGCMPWLEVALAWL